MYEGTWAIRPCPRGEVRRAGQGARRRRSDGKRPRPAGLRRPRDGAGLPRRGAPGARPVPPGGRCSGVRAHPRDDRRRAAASASTATTTWTASARPRSPSRPCASLGADVEWHLPSRFEEGYGVSRDTLARLAEEGCALVLTVDCGITAVEEVAEARAAGLDVIVTDHHRPGETLPDCPVVATRPSEYPFPELCGTGVVFKLLEALGVEGLDRHLDLVALATVADVVPLAGREPRARRRRACGGWRGPTSPGLRALMRAGGVDPAARGHGLDRLPPGAADQCGRAARPSGRRARAPADGGRGRGPTGSRASSRR